MVITALGIGLRSGLGRLGGPIGDLWGAGATTPHRPSIGPPDFNELTYGGGQG